MKTTTEQNKRLVCRRSTPCSTNVNTPQLKTAPVYPEVIARTPAGRWGHPDECAGAAVFLASHASDFFIGSTLVVDGGYAIR
jgi:NAD(P)-dependent dehydrogenase (short-subunit alcohol dehydrogenase family)